MAVSTVPAAARGLRTVLTAAVAGIPVGYGPPQEDAEAGERVDVLYDPTEGSVAEVRAPFAAIGQGAKEEEYDLPCTLVVWSGDTDTDAIEARIERAYALLATCDNAIEANYTLGAAVRLAHISSHSSSIEDSRVTVRFSVSCVARTSD